MIRLYVAGDLDPGRAVPLTAEQSHYLTTVMRQREGAELAVFNGRDGEWLATLNGAGQRSCRLKAVVKLRDQPQASGPDLLVALVKRSRLETIVEKAVELGAARLRLVTTRRTNADHARLARLQAIAVEAAEQTGRLDVPAIEPPVPLDRLLQAWSEGHRLMFCDEAGDDPEAPWGGEAGRARPVLSALKDAGPGPWSVLIGPEGGFDPAERDRLRACPFVVPVTLGPRILRADTAAIAALTLWQAMLGDWREDLAVRP